MLEIRESATGTQAFGTYNWMLRTSTGSIVHAGYVKDFPRDAGGWALVRRVLLALMEEETR